VAGPAVKDLHNLSTCVSLQAQKTQHVSGAQSAGAIWKSQSCIQHVHTETAHSADFERPEQHTHCTYCQSHLWFGPLLPVLLHCAWWLLLLQM
jgi:hypothetical protein